MTSAQTLFWWQDEDAIPDDELAEADAAGAALEDELDRAAKEVEAANLRYDEALRRYRCAPHGELSSRREGLRLANSQILRAELRYAEIRRQERP